MSRKNEEKAAILETIIIIDFGYREQSEDCDAGSQGGHEEPSPGVRIE